MASREEEDDTEMVFREEEDEEMAARVAENDRAYEEYWEKVRLEAWTYVYWDIHNLPLPYDDFIKFQLNIRQALARQNYRGPVEIFAYGDASKFDPHLQQQLRRAWIRVKPFPDGDRLDHYFDMFAELKMRGLPDTNLLVISDDDDNLASFLHDMIPRFFIMLAVSKPNFNVAFYSPADVIWLWPQLSAGQSPLSRDEIEKWDKEVWARWKAREKEEEEIIARKKYLAMLKSESMTLVYWDIHNFPIPETCDVQSFQDNIRKALDRENYRGPIKIFAYGDVCNIPLHLQKQLVDASIRIIPGDGCGWHCSAGVLFPAKGCNIPINANLLLISDDDVHHALHVHGLIPHSSIMLAVSKKPVKPALHCGADHVHGLVPHSSIMMSVSEKTPASYCGADHVWLWPDLAAGRSPLSYDRVSGWLQQDERVSGRLQQDERVSMCEEEEEEEEDDEEEEDYIDKVKSVAKTFVYWDIGNFPILPGHDVRSFQENIRKALDRENYRGPTEIVAFGYASYFPPHLQQQLLNASIQIKLVPDDYLYWEYYGLLFSEMRRKSTSIANVLLISDDDENLTHYVHLMIPRFCVMLAVSKRPARVGFFYSADHIWLWPVLAAGGSPLSRDTISKWHKEARMERQARVAD